MKIELDQETALLIQWHAAATGLSRSALIDILLSAHLAELWELRTFMERGSSKSDDTRSASNLLQSYGGGESIVEGIKRIDPTYSTLEERFVKSLCHDGEKYAD